MRLLSILLSASLCATHLIAQVATGIDVLEQQNFAPLREIAARHGGHLRLGVLTNQVGIDAHERRTIDILRKDAAAAVPGLSVVTLFSPEHGINGLLDQPSIGNSTDPESGLPIVSLFGSAPAQRHPSAAQLAGLDAVVIDLQDVGVRFWTYQTLMGYFLEASAPNRIDIVVLDRPNPINGLAVQGPVTTSGRENYISYYAEPVRPGMTMGELANLFNGEKRLGAHLTVVKMSGWNRAQWYDETGLLWVNPSPNLRSLTQAMVYPGINLLASTNIAFKGIDTPFERFGAPWIVATQLAAYLNARKIPGLSFMPVYFTPVSQEPHYQYVGQKCEGVEVVVNDRNAIDAPELGVEVASALWKLYPKSFEVDQVDRHILNRGVLDQIKSGIDPRTIAGGWQSEVAGFRDQRAKYLLYK